MEFFCLKKSFLSFGLLFVFNQSLAMHHFKVAQRVMGRSAFNSAAKNFKPRKFLVPNPADAAMKAKLASMEKSLEQIQKNTAATTGQLCSFERKFSELTRENRDLKQQVTAHLQAHKKSSQQPKEDFLDFNN